MTMVPAAQTPQSSARAAVEPLDAASYARLSALFDELSEQPEPDRSRRLQQLQEAGEALAPRLQRMLAALQGPRTEDWLPALLPQGAAGMAEAQAQAEAAYSPGQQVGPWTLLQLLGRGGMAEVWQARRSDGLIKRAVALKLPFTAPGQAAAARARAERFQRERDILASLRHPHIAALLDAGVEPDGQAWLALEHVAGQRITAWCDEHRLRLRERVLLFRQVLQALRHAHGQLVIHRDVKPANVLVDEQGQVRLLDFGIAKLLEAPGEPMPDTTLTQQAGRPLTPRYASPEQLQGQPLTVASDIYALGVLLHELLTGHLPYRPARQTAAAVEQAIVHDEPPLPSRSGFGAAEAQARAETVAGLRRQLHPELDAVLLKALAKAPAARYASVDAMLDDVDRWLACLPVRARTPSAWFRLRRFVARHPVGVGAGSAAAAGLVALASTATWLGLQAQAESRRAELARNFLLDVFRKADVDQSRGADISAREMLAWGRERAAALPVEPALRAALLMDIGGSQMQSGDYAGAEPSLAQAAELYRQLGQPAQQALAQAERTEIALRHGDVALATRHLQQLRQLRDGLPAAGGAELRARTEHLSGWLALLEGRAAEALAHDERAAAAALKAWPAGDAMRLQVLQQRARSADLVQPGAGLPLLDALLVEFDGSARARDLGAAGHVMRAALEFDRAALLAGAGQYARIRQALEPGVAICERDVGPQAESCNGLRRILVLALLRQGEHAAAGARLAAIQREAQGSSQPFRRAEALLLWGRTLASLGQVNSGASPWPEITRIGEGQFDSPLPADFRHQALHVLAEAALRGGRGAEAMRWLERAGRDPEAATPHRQLRGRALLAAALQVAGAQAEAHGAWASVQQQAGTLLGERHPMTCLYALNALRLPREAAPAPPQQSAATETCLQEVLRPALGEQAPAFTRAAAWLQTAAPVTPATGADLFL